MTELFWRRFKRIRRDIWPENEDSLPNMSFEEFQAEIEAGKKYCIIESLVVDVEEFMRAHPGGKFSIE